MPELTWFIFMCYRELELDLAEFFPIIINTPDEDSIFNLNGVAKTLLLKVEEIGEEPSATSV